MSNAETRGDIAAAVSTVDGLKGYVKRPNVLNTGDAWPQWRGGEVAEGGQVMNTWAVLVVLPSDETTADEWADLYGQQLADALVEVIYIESIAPAAVSTSSGDMYALMLTGRSE